MAVLPYRWKDSRPEARFGERSGSAKSARAKRRRPVWRSGSARLRTSRYVDNGFGEVQDRLLRVIEQNPDDWIDQDMCTSEPDFPNTVEVVIEAAKSAVLRSGSIAEAMDRLDAVWDRDPAAFDFEGSRRDSA